MSMCRTSPYEDLEEAKEAFYFGSLVTPCEHESIRLFFLSRGVYIPAIYRQQGKSTGDEVACLSFRFVEYKDW